MIRAATTSLMLGLLLMQATFGLCPYAHGNNVSARVSHTLAFPACCERCVPSAPGDATPTPIQSKGACHGFCTYVKADTVDVDAHDDAIVELVAPSVAACHPSCAIRPSHPTTDSWAHHFAVRLHVLYGIILI